MVARHRSLALLVLLTTSCGSATSAPPQQQDAVEGAVDPAPAPITPPPTESGPVADAPVDTAPEVTAPADPANADSPYLGTWGCRGPISHVAMSYEVSLELHASGRFELSYSDVTPEGGRVVRMQGDWESRPIDDELAIDASADIGSETTWSGDMHREQHRSGRGGPTYASQRRRTGVSTAERRWVVLDEDPATPQIRLDPQLGTRVGRAVTIEGQETWPRCDPGRFND